MHNSHYNAYILAPAAGPNTHQPSAAPPSGPGNSAPPVGGTGSSAQQYVDYSMSMAPSGYIPAPAPQGSVSNIQPSTSSGPLLSAGQYSHYQLTGQVESAAQTGLLIFSFLVVKCIN